jgi:hypothetical protein
MAVVLYMNVKRTEKNLTKFLASKCTSYAELNRLCHVIDHNKDYALGLIVTMRELVNTGDKESATRRAEAKRVVDYLDAKFSAAVESTFTGRVMRMLAVYQAVLWLYVVRGEGDVKEMRRTMQHPDVDHYLRTGHYTPLPYTLLERLSAFFSELLD